MACGAEAGLCYRGGLCLGEAAEHDIAFFWLSGDMALVRGFSTRGSSLPCRPHGPGLPPIGAHVFDGGRRLRGGRRADLVRLSSPVVVRGITWVESVPGSPCVGDLEARMQIRRSAPRRGSTG